MGRGILVMNQGERYRLVVMSRVQDRAMTIREASEVMRISYRQSRRIYKRYREEGDKGLVPRNRGRLYEVKETVLTLYREQYWDFGSTLAAGL